MNTVTLSNKAFYDPTYTDQDRLNRFARIGMKDALGYFFDLEPEDVAPVQYNDIAFEDYDINDILPAVCQNYWFHDSAQDAAYHGYLHDMFDGSGLNTSFIKKAQVFSQDFPIAFDIETTAVTEYTEITKNGKKLRKCTKANAYAYHMQVLIDKTIIHCNKWEQVLQIWRDLMDRCNMAPDANFDKYVLKVWIANMGYEFGFMAARMTEDGFDWTKIFTREAHNPITGEAELKGYHTPIMFVDALKLSGTSLERTAKENNLPTQKTHDLDYSKKRNSQTPLTPEELYYCSADVRILGDFHRYLFENYYMHYLPIPMTFTGILRHDVKALFSYVKSNKYPIKTERWWVRNQLKGMLPATYEEYSETMAKGFSGGYTAANSMNAGKVLTDVNGWDFTSSYPYVIFFKQFPMEPWHKVPNATWQDYLKISTAGKTTKNCVMVKIHFKKIMAKANAAIFSAAKTYEYDEAGKSIVRYTEQQRAIIDNGKILYADNLTALLTEQDIANFMDFYEWEGEPDIEMLQYSKAGYLPDYVRIATITYYQKKAILKKTGQEGTTAYKLAKSMTNSNFGLMCQKEDVGDIMYDPETFSWNLLIPEEYNSIEERYQEAMFGKHVSSDRAPKTKLSPYWGIYVTALARRNLLENGVLPAGDDFIYCDTDSVYVTNPDAHAQHIDAYNAATHAENRKIVDMWNTKHGFDRAVYDAETDPDKKAKYLREHFGVLIEMVEDLGEFDKLNKHSNYTRFKTLGAKRYLKEEIDENGTAHVEQTIAGLPKTALTDFCKENNLDPFEYFNSGMVIPACKNAHTYNIEKHSDVITDEFGNTETMEELTSVGIFDIDFTMEVTSEYWKLLDEAVQKLRRRDYREFYKEMIPNAETENS